MMSLKKKKPKTTGTSAEVNIITLENGWKTISETGVKPFFQRIEELDETSMDKDEDSNAKIPMEQFTQTYDTIFNMAIQREPYNFSESLYQRHTSALITPALQTAKSKHGVAFLSEWVKRWRITKWVVDGMQRMFMYLDRFYVPNSEDLLTMQEQGYTLFRKNVFDSFKDTARNAILECIKREREDEDQDRDLLKKAIAVFTELGHKLTKVELHIYKDDFQKKFIESTKKYYQLRSQSWLDQDSCPDYMIKAEMCIQQEQGRLNAYLHPSTTDALMDAVRFQLLKVHQKKLLDKPSGIAAMLEKESRKDLARLYRLFEAIQGGLDPVAAAMGAHVKKLGNVHLEESKRQQGYDKNHTLIRNLIDLHERFLGIVQNNFQNAQVFQKALKEAFEDFINKEYYTSNYLARFVNDLLKKGSKLVFEDLEQTMDHIVMLYGYIRDKDIFERDYQLFLSNRLLTGTSKSEQYEKHMIGKLKAECGYQWTSKLEGMFKDIVFSKELMRQFKSEHKDFGIELDVSVCTTGCWPSSETPSFNFPQVLSPVAEAFKKFYLDQNSGRRLNWRMDKGQAEIAVKFNPKCIKILSVSTFQMLIMLAFNHKDTITFKEIKNITGLPEDPLKVHILSLAHPKVAVLQKKPGGKTVSDKHIFRIAPGYKDPRKKIRIPVFHNLSDQGQGQNLKYDRELKIRRRHMIDASIVRIMKTRQTLKHHQLAAEVIEQLKQRFQPSGQDIKKRIEALIDQEYLERDPEQRNVYNYLA